MQFRYSIRYMIALVPGVLALLGNLLNSWYAFGAVIWVAVILVALDWMIKPSERRSPQYTDPLIPNLVVLLSSLLHLAVIMTLLRLIATGEVAAWQMFYCTLACGINSGLSGFIVAHELVHRKTRFENILGQINLLANSYMHFNIEHLQGHHRHVGTLKDPATALYGESLYQFMARTIPAQWWNALQTEADRLRKEGKELPYGLSNYVVQTGILTITLHCFIASFFGGSAYLFFVLQNMVAIFLLEYVNYIEHYGLLRTGTKLGAAQSWHTDSFASRVSLFELNLHAEHHLKASRPYYELYAHEESPRLPSGYFGMFPIALFPKAWFKRIDPLIPGAMLPDNHVSIIS